MADAAQSNSDQLAFWNGAGGRTWVARQAHTDITLAPVMEALVAFSAPRPGDDVLDVGCGCGASTLEFARAVGPTGSVAALDISAPMLAEGAARAKAAGIVNVDWREADAATATLDPYDLVTSAFGLMFFGDPVSAFKNIRAASKSGARLTCVCWRSLAENPWIGAPIEAVTPHLQPRSPADPEAPGMFAFADQKRVTRILTAAGWAPPHFEKLDVDIDIAAGRGLDEAVVQSTQIGAVNSWLRGQPPEIVNGAVSSIRDTLAPHARGACIPLPAAAWLISSAPA